MFSKNPLNAIGNLLQKFKREMFMSKSKPHIGTTLKREKCFEGIHFSACDADDLLDVNQRFLAAVLDDSLTFTVIPVGKAGRFDGKPPRICGHNRKITNLKWNPFDQQEIASSSADGTIKLWRIPDDGLTKDTSICRSLLIGHKGSISLLEWHVSAYDVLLSFGADMKCMIWNVRIESIFMEITLPGSDVPTSVTWCPDGSSFVVLWGDQTMRVVEPRSGSSIATTKSEGRSGRFKKVICVDDKKLLTVGSSESCIVLKLWEMDGGNLKLLKEETTNDNNAYNYTNNNKDNSDTDISFSSFFDRQQMILYIFQKENGCLQNYKITHNDVISLGNQVTTTHKSIAMMTASSRNEIKFYKITSHKNICELISVIGNKTIDSGKHQSPKYSADQWFQGQPQLLSPVTVTVKKPESSLSSPTLSQSLSSPPSMMTSSSSFIHLTFSSPKMNKKLTKGDSTDSEQCLFRPDLIPRRNSAIGQQHYLYSDVFQSPISSYFESMKSLPVGGDGNASPNYDNFSRNSQLIRNKAYMGGNERRCSDQFNATHLHPLENGLGQNKVNHKRASPRMRLHKSPTLNSVRLRRMKQKEMMFHSSSSSSSTEGLDGRGERWNDNPLYSHLINKSRKYQSRPRSKGRLEGQRKHSLIPDRCSIIDFGPLDDALNEVINQNRSISRSTCNLSQVSKLKENLSKFQKFEPIIETNIKNIPTHDLFSNKTKRISSRVGEVRQNPLMNGYHNNDHYRSAFSIVKPPYDLPIFGPDVPNPRIFNGSNVVRPVPQMIRKNNFHSTEHLPNQMKQGDYKFEFVNLKPSTQLLRTGSLKESPLVVARPGIPTNRPRQPSSSFSLERMQKINQSTPHLVASSSAEHFTLFQNLQSSLQTICEDETTIQSVNGCYSSSSSLSTTSEATLHSDNSTINYELNIDYQQISHDSDLSGPDEISNSFVYTSPVTRLQEVLELQENDVVPKNKIFAECSRQKEEIVDLKKALTDRELQIRRLEKQLKRLSVCSDLLPMST